MQKKPMAWVSGDFEFIERSISLSTQAVVVANEAVERCNLWFYIQGGGATVAVSTLSNVTTGTGFLLSPTTGIMKINSRDDAAICWQKWWGISSLITPLRVIEVFYRPKG